jgi:hypothetical protein
VRLLAPALSAVAERPLLEGVTHNAAGRGMLAHPQMKRELAGLARGYQKNDRAAAGKMK